MTHPSSLDLEAFACGESSPIVSTHVAECGVCGAFVEELRQLVSNGPSAAEADALLARLLEGIAPSPSTTVKPLRQDPRRKLWLVATSVITPVAAAAAILLLARTGPRPDTLVPAPTTPTTTETPASTQGDRIQMAPLPSGVSHPDPDTTFKGGVQLAVVRERAGEQKRFSSPVRVRPGDRLRVEVALDREQAILGAVLGDDGSYLELMPSALRGPGTHFSERSAKVDASPTFGTVVIGTPEAVALARETKRFDGVAALRVEWEGTP